MFKRLLLKALETWRARQSQKIPYTELQAIHLEHLKTIPNRKALLSQLPKKGVVAEVGVLNGDFSANILEECHPDQLHLIDVWAGKEGAKNRAKIQRRFAGEIESGRVILYQGYSTTVINQFPENHFDWVYLDTDHSYATTITELELSANVLKNNGLILGHDYVTGNWNGGVRYGVVEAVNEFCVRNNWEFIFLTAETHRHVSFAIKRRASND